MNAYVTGSTGGVGQNLIRELAGRGWKVYATYRSESKRHLLEIDPKVIPLSVDLDSVEAIRATMPDDVDVIFHVAANISHDHGSEAMQHHDNVDVTHNLVEVALDRRIRFVFTSTGATLGHANTTRPEALKIKNSYVRTKRLSEIEVYEGIAAGLDAVILHPIIIVGEHDRNAYKVIFSGLRDKTLKHAFPGRLIFGHAREIAKAHVEAATHGASGTRYVLGGIHTSWKAFYDSALRAMKVDRKFSVASKFQLYLMAWAGEAWQRVTGKVPLITVDVIRLLGDCQDISAEEKKLTRTVLKYDDSISLDQMTGDCYRWMLRERII